MQHALELANRAIQDGEVPVGAVIVVNEEIIGEGWNQSISTSDSTAHAEIQALRSATTLKQNYRIPDATLYVTLEPCLMCTGAIFHARTNRVVFGAYDPKSGVAGSVINLFMDKKINHHTEVVGGILEEDCAKVLKNFFRMRR